MDNLSEDHMRAMEQAYSELIQPQKLVEYFADDKEFKEWAELGTVKDIKAALIAFEGDELYHHCAILKEVLITKLDGHE